MISVIRLLFSLAFVGEVVMGQTGSFDTSFVELDTSKMICTLESHYAISHPALPSGWKSASVNDDELTIVTQDNQLVVKKYSSLTGPEKSSLESARANLASVLRMGPFNVKSQTGYVKLTTFSKNGGTSSMGTGGASSSSSSSSASTSAAGLSIQKTGPNSFIVSRADFPFNWQRVFVQDNLVTTVHKDGRVVMLARELMRPDERSRLDAIRAEVEQSVKANERLASNLANSLRNPMDFVNRALGGIFG